ncbi:hypothetical protein KSP39_PZI007958 [Platanthera zijinensis]|uniref:Uncharacterized protein n=1 Tax=Platanthera zijinensis TaxID=2320716 RepID=A0AAP0BPZ2_9ASPA
MASDHRRPTSAEAPNLDGAIGGGGRSNQRSGHLLECRPYSFMIHLATGGGRPPASSSPVYPSRAPPFECDGRSNGCSGWPRGPMHLPTEQERMEDHRRDPVDEEFQELVRTVYEDFRHPGKGIGTITVVEVVVGANPAEDNNNLPSRLMPWT